MTIMAIFEILFENISAPQTVEYSILVNEIIKKTWLDRWLKSFLGRTKRKIYGNYFHDKWSHFKSLLPYK